MPGPWAWHDSFICVKYVWHDSFICVTWLMHMCEVCVTWLIHMCDMTHAYMWHMCDMTHSYVWHDSFICVTWLIHMCTLPCTCGAASSSISQISALQSLYVVNLIADWLLRIFIGPPGPFTSGAGTSRTSQNFSEILRISQKSARYYRVAKMHRMPSFAGLFPQKSPS